ncbi:MAG: hypothetical protein Q9218_008045, partial [Villophora microphyllina]
MDHPRESQGPRTKSLMELTGLSEVERLETYTVAVNRANRMRPDSRWKSSDLEPLGLPASHLSLRPGAQRHVHTTARHCDSPMERIRPPNTPHLNFTSVHQVQTIHNRDRELLSRGQKGQTSTGSNANKILNGSQTASGVPWDGTELDPSIIEDKRAVKIERMGPGVR